METSKFANDIILDDRMDERADTDTILVSRNRVSREDSSFTSSTVFILGDTNLCHLQTMRVNETWFSSEDAW